MKNLLSLFASPSGSQFQLILSLCISCFVQYIYAHKHSFLCSYVCMYVYLERCVLMHARRIVLPRTDVRMFAYVRVLPWFDAHTLFLPLPLGCQIHSYLVSIVTSFSEECTMTLPTNTQHLIFLQTVSGVVTLTCYV